MSFLTTMVGPRAGSITGGVRGTTGAFPMGLSSILSAGAQLAGGLIGKAGQEDTNRLNQQLAREQMRFQERMSSTAYQRSSRDLQKAGLNRILALGSPASTPAGARAVMQNPGALLGEGVSRAANSALAARIQDSQIKQIEAQADLALEDVLNRRATRGLINQQVRTAIAQERQFNARAALDEFEQGSNELMGETMRVLQRISPAMAGLVGAAAALGGVGLARGRSPAKKTTQAKPAPVKPTPPPKPGKNAGKKAKEPMTEKTRQEIQALKDSLKATEDKRQSYWNRGQNR